MRILKYLFLLLLLSLIALSVFIATQKGDFTVERSKIINSPKPALFTYVNDLHNWKEWNSLATEDSLVTITLSNKTIGSGSFCTWQGDQGEGNYEIVSTEENTNIIQKINFNGNSAEATMSFKDTIGGTKVSWKAKGKMDFMVKVSSFFYGGAQESLGMQFEKSLSNLNKILDYEINTYSVKLEGVTNRPEIFYLGQTFTSELAKVRKNTGIVIAKISLFCKENNISVNGKPFIIYHTYDPINKLTKLSICIPIKDPIFISEGSDIVSDKITEIQAVKTTLTGDYSHRSEAMNKAKEYFTTNNIIPSDEMAFIEVFNIGERDSKTPSKWVTEFYYPIKPKIIAKPRVIIKSDTLKKVNPVKETAVLKEKHLTKDEVSSKKETIVKPKEPVKIEPTINPNKETSN